jgi:hypothetical protein
MILRRVGTELTGHPGPAGGADRRQGRAQRPAQDLEAPPPRRGAAADRVRQPAQPGRRARLPGPSARSAGVRRGGQLPGGPGALPARLAALDGEGPAQAGPAHLQPADQRRGPVDHRVLRPVARRAPPQPGPAGRAALVRHHRRQGRGGARREAVRAARGLAKATRAALRLRAQGPRLPLRGQAVPRQGPHQGHHAPVAHLHPLAGHRQPVPRQHGLHRHAPGPPRAAAQPDAQRRLQGRHDGRRVAGDPHPPGSIWPWPAGRSGPPPTPARSPARWTASAWTWPAAARTRR